MKKSDLIFEEALRLHSIGFAIHWADVKSKKPLGGAWSTGPRWSVQELKEKYRLGMNVGFRAGDVSKIRDLNLIVIDCDFKITPEHPRHDFELIEFERVIAELTEKEKTMPRVDSGRKNGSRHFYTLTSLTLRGGKLTKSETLVKKKVKDETTGEIKETEHPAWVIETLANGQFCVLPPSIHPVSGLTYDWASPLTSPDEIPEMSADLAGELVKKKEYQAKLGSKNFDLEYIDAENDSRISDDDFDVIANGDWITAGTRSERLFELAGKLARSGLSENDIVSLLTDSNYNVAQYPLSKRGGNRKSAAQWVYDYTIGKAFELKSPEAVFREPYVEKNLTVIEAKAQELEMLETVDWKSKFQRFGRGDDIGCPRNKLLNVMAIIENGDIEKSNPFAHNSFSGYTSLIRGTPYGAEGDTFTEKMANSIIEWCARAYRVQPSLDMVLMAVERLAYRNDFHPVRDYLESLSWDGKPRLGSWLVDYLGAVGPEKYLAAVGEKTLVAMVKRVFEPGCKFDQVLVLEGPQGCGKSTAVAILGGEWACDAYLDPSNKDTVLYLSGAWAVEVPELSGMDKADQNHLKAFITKGFDRIRPPYGRTVEDIERQCVFIGTTNDENYLRDETGARRYWPVKIKQVQFTDFARDRDQLFAEAKLSYDLGEPVYINDVETLRLAEMEQSKRISENDYVDQIAEWAASKLAGEKMPDNIDLDGFKIEELFGSSDAPLGCFMSAAGKFHLRNALRRLGFEYGVIWRGSKTLRRWVLSPNGAAKLRLS